MDTKDEIPRLSPTIAHTLITKSCLHAWQRHRLLGAEEDTPTEAKDRGKIMEALILGAPAPVQIVDAEDWRGKAAKESRDQARESGLIPVLVHKMVEYVDAAQHVKENLKRMDSYAVKGLDKALYQVPLLWDSEGCPCKGIPDVVCEGGIIYDLKSTSDASQEHIQRAMVTYGYDIQHAAYIEGLEAAHPDLAGRVKLRFIFYETEAPWAVQVVEPSGSMKTLGQQKWARAKAAWAKCLKENSWPGYSTDITYIEALPWQMANEFAETMQAEFKKENSNV